VQCDDEQIQNNQSIRLRTRTLKSKMVPKLRIIAAQAFLSCIVVTLVMHHYVGRKELAEARYDTANGEGKSWLRSTSMFPLMIS